MKKLIALSILFAGITGLSFAQQNIRKEQFNLAGDGLAVSGYDVVAYFTQNKAVKGDKQFAVFAEGALYYFSSKANKDLFLKNWRAYEPQYGGWCAYAMGARNDKVAINPETFKILNGKLYLFYNKRDNNTLLKWNSEEASLKARADVNWMAFFH